MASDLEEVQNVVDVAFGSMSDEVEAFARTTVQAYGMSELTAKRMASTFMAMSNGMGIAQNTGKNMSLQLTALAGDMASFYNVEQEVAQTALNSVFTGETESLKKFGVVLTEANLSAFALSQGITKSYSAMSQAEKVLLRYNYVLNATKNAQGDFARTSGSWANQVRILKEQWQQLLGILGSGLTKILTPVVKALNSMLSSLISIGNAITKVFGGKQTESMSTTVKDTASSVGDLDSGLTDAGESAKKLQRTLAGFDELNVLNPKEESSSGSGAGGGTGGDTGSSTVADFKVDETQVEGVKGRLEQFLNDCKDIIDKWQQTIPKLELNFDTERALNDLQSIGTNIFNTIMGWGSFVVTIAIDIANDLDIGRLGNDVLSVINSLTELASTATNIVVPALTTFYEIGISPLTQAIGEVADEMLQWVNDKLQGWTQWFSDNDEQIQNFATNLGIIVAPLSTIVGELLKIAWDILSAALDLIDQALKGIADTIINMPLETLAAITGALLTIAAIKFGDDIAKMFKSMKENSDGVVDNLSHLEGYITGGGKISTALTQIKTKFDNTFGKPARDILKSMREEYHTTTTAIGASDSIFTKVKGSVSSLKVGFSGLWTVIKAHPLSIILPLLVAIGAAVYQLWTTNEEFRAQVTALWNETLKPMIKEVWAKLKELWEEHLKPLIDQIKEASGGLVDKLKELWDTVLVPLIGVITKVVGVLLTFILGVLEGILGTVIDVVGDIVDQLSGWIEFIEGVFTGDWEKAWNGVKKIFKATFDAIKNIFTGVIDSIVNGVEKAIKAIKNLFGMADNETEIKVSTKTQNKAQNINTPRMEAFATGGVLTSPTVGLMGEYAGASNNPEIVTPQSLMRETMEDANSSVINAIFAIGNQISKSVDEKNMDIYMDTAKVTRRITKEQTAQKKQMGTSLVMV